MLHEPDCRGTFPKGPIHVATVGAVKCLLQVSGFQSYAIEGFGLRSLKMDTDMGTGVV